MECEAELKYQPVDTAETANSVIWERDDDSDNPDIENCAFEYENEDEIQDEIFFEESKFQIPEETDIEGDELNSNGMQQQIQQLNLKYEIPSETHIRGELYSTGMLQYDIMDVTTDSAAESEQLLTCISGRYMCAFCHQEFPNEIDYSEHIKTHSIKIHECVQCDKSFSTAQRLNRHNRSHINDAVVYQCEICEKVYRIRSNLNRHMQTVHGDNENLLCKICNKTFSRSDSFKLHMKNHNNKERRKCHLCTASFTSERYLQLHIKKHQTKKEREDVLKSKFMCTQCAKISINHLEHKNHLLSHSNDRPFQCELCTKSFRTMAALITHERVHSNTSQSQCEFCLRSFRQSDELKEHQRLFHMINIIELACPICDKSFRQKRSLAKHMQTHSQECYQKCTMCPMTFKKLDELKVHMMTEHGDIESENNECLLESIDEYQDIDSKSIVVNFEISEHESSNLIVQESAENDMKHPSACENINLISSSDESEQDDGDIDINYENGILLIVDDKAPVRFNSFYILDNNDS